MFEPLCLHCGKPMHDAWCNQKYHNDCREEVIKIRNSQKWFEEKAERPKVFCGICQKEIVDAHPNQKFCSDECKKVARVQAKAKRQKAQFSGVNKAKPQKPKPLTSDEITKRANDITMKAKESGLSYGKYKAQEGLYDKIYKGAMI